MTKSFPIPYAVNDEGDLISAIEASANGNFYCPECNERLIFKNGQIKVKHFSHKAKSNCSGETVLHKIGKRLIIKHILKHSETGTEIALGCDPRNPFDKSTSPFVHVRHKDFKFPKKETNHFNYVRPYPFFRKISIRQKSKEMVCLTPILAKIFQGAALAKEEVPFGKFVPDVTIYDVNGERIGFVEILVSHAVEEEKRLFYFEQEIPWIEIRADDLLELSEEKILSPTQGDHIEAISRCSVCLRSEEIAKKTAEIKNYLRQEVNILGVREEMDLISTIFDTAYYDSCNDSILIERSELCAVADLFDFELPLKYSPIELVNFGAETECYHSGMVNNYREAIINMPEYPRIKEVRLFENLFKRWTRQPHDASLNPPPYLTSICSS